MTERDAVIDIMRRVFKAGKMRRLPKRREDAAVVMALSLADLDPDGIFDESEINLHLSSWLDGIGSETGVADHVTLRRHLVDHGFLRRASDGVVYRVRSEAITAVLAPSARSIDPKQIFSDVESARLQRSRTYGQ